MATQQATPTATPQATPPPELVIFDCDGVLVDSELIASRELAAFLTDLGRETTALECRRTFTGLSIQSVFERVEADWGLHLPADFVEQLRARDRAAFDRDLQAVPGVSQTLDTLSRAGVRYCVASSGTPEKIRHSLEITNLLDRFDGHLFSATQVANGKPAPDLFLHAAQAMNAPAERCVVVEDSPAGIQGARAAGIRVLGFAGATHCDADHARSLNGADTVFTDMRKLSTIIGI